MKISGVSFKEIQILITIVQYYDVMNHVHSKTILHRDLKSQNIFLTKHGGVKIGDFSIAKELNSTQDVTKTQVGMNLNFSLEIFR